jgi:hypothetical protein
MASACKLFANASQAELGERMQAELGERMQAFCACKPYGERLQAIQRANASYAELGERMLAIRHTADGARQANASFLRMLAIRRATASLRHTASECKAELGERMQAFCEC